MSRVVPSRKIMPLRGPTCKIARFQAELKFPSWTECGKKAYYKTKSKTKINLKMIKIALTNGYIWPFYSLYAYAVVNNNVDVNPVFAFPIDYFHRFWKDRICISKYFLSLQQDGICQHPPYSLVWTSYGHLPDKQPETELGGIQTTFPDTDTDIRGIRKIGKKLN